MVKQSRLFDSKLQAENNRLRQRVNELETTVLEARVREQTLALQQEIDALRSELKRFQRTAGAPGVESLGAQPPSNGSEIAPRIQAASLLQEWEQFIEHINDANPVVLYLYNFTENRVLYSDNEIAKILGYSLEEIAGLGPNLFPTLMHPDDVSRMPAHLRTLQDSSPGEVCEFEYRMKHKNGAWRWFYSRDVVTQRDGEGHPVEGIGIANEVTQRKLTEGKLRNQANLLQNISDAIISTDTDFRITQWNRSAERIYGWKEHEVTGRRPSELLRITFLNQTREEVLKAFYAQGRWDGETRQVRKDGTPIYVHSSVTQVLDAAGKFAGSAAINRDVTEQKRIQDALKMSEARFRTLIEEAPTAIGIARDGITIYANPRYLLLFGFNSMDELVGRPIIEQIAPQCREDVLERVRRRDQNPASDTEYESIGLRRDGSQFPFQVSVTRVDLADGPATVALFTDISLRKQTEEALKESEKRYRQFIELSPYAIFIQSEGRFAFANPAGLRMFGAFSPEQLLGKRILDLTHPDHHDALAERIHLTNDLQQEAPLTEGVFFRLDGTVFTTESVSVPLLVEGKAGGLSFVRDITEIKAARAAVRESEARFQAVFDSAVVGIALVKIPQGMAVQTNAKLRAMLGYSQAELERMSFVDYTHPDDLKTEWPLYQEFTLGRRNQYQIEKRYIRKDGSRFWARLNVFPIEAPSQRLGVAIVEDITERKKAEEALHAANRFNLEVIHGAGEGVIVFDRELRYQIWNPFMEKLTGYKASEVLNRKAVEVFPFDEQQILGLDQVLAGKSFSSPDFSFKSPRMEKAAWLSATYSPYLDIYGNVIGIISTVRDVTERVQADMMRQEIEILRNMDRFRDELISNVSHEMRNPLGLILVMVTALLRNTSSIDTATLIEFLRDIEQETRSLQSIVDNLLDASRLQSGRMRLLRKSADLAKIVQRTVRLAAEQAPEHVFRLHLPEGSLVTIMDPNRIEQVLKNILDNAVKYSPPGGHIDVTARINQGFYQVEVCDEGPGIQPGDRERIFERFYRGLELHSNGVPGVGLGLPISRSIIEAHEGKLWAEARPAPESGSTFIFTLPIKIDPGFANSGDWPDEP